MRSLKLFAAAAVLAAFVAGPVLAQDAMMAPETEAPAADTAMTAPATAAAPAKATSAKHHKAAKKHAAKKAAKKHHKKAAKAAVEEVSPEAAQ